VLWRHQQLAVAAPQAQLPAGAAPQDPQAASPPPAVAVAATVAVAVAAATMVAAAAEGEEKKKKIKNQKKKKKKIKEPVELSRFRTHSLFAPSQFSLSPEELQARLEIATQRYGGSYTPDQYWKS
jgi:hypothetical protein